MKQFTIIGSLATAAMLLGSVSAFAQPVGYQQALERGGREGVQGRPHAVTVKYGTDIIYTLEGRTVTRRDGRTLKALATVTLGENKGRGGKNDRWARNDRGGRDNRQAGERGGRMGARPMMPAHLLVVGQGRQASVLVITHRTFYRLNAKNLTIIVKTELPRMGMGRPGAGRPDGQMPCARPDRERQAGGECPQGAPRDDRREPNARGDRDGKGREHMMAGGPQGRGFMTMRAPEVRGNTLYLQRGPRLLAIDYRTGKVISTKNLGARPQQGGERGGHAR